MKLRGIAILVLAVSATCLFGAVVRVPVVSAGRTINQYQRTRAHPDMVQDLRRRK